MDYDLDEHDACWLECLNSERAASEEEPSPVPPEALELVLDRLEKDWFLQVRPFAPVQPRNTDAMFS